MSRRHSIRKLKDPTVCRVFYSSPFNGMEGEREELTRRYWPQLASACNSVGVRFAPVDMRWGITTDQSTNHQTINICLREIDRSDLFLGFFGQRYGWCGLKDDVLQRTFDAAVSSYPWLERYRDRSVTELEFLHGHLNSPGEMPAVICFRDKRWDEVMRGKGEEKGDSREVYKYSPESLQAVDYMNDLINRVKATESDCVALHLAYKDPIEGARLMFEHTWQFIQDVVLRQPETTQTVRQTELAQHTAFLVSRCSSYHGGHDSLAQLNNRIDEGTKHLMITGDTGSGKSALLCNWICSRQQSNPDDVLLYHFVECARNSNDPKNILQRMVASLRHVLDAGNGEVEKDYLDLDEMDELKLLSKWQANLAKVAKIHRKVIIVVDELQKVQYKQKIVRPLFWLPKVVPVGVHFVTSTDSTDSTSREELVDERHYDTMVIQPLTEESRNTFCRDILLQRGKTLSDSQLDKIINADRISNPLFLKVILEELCMFGKFRELDKKIDTLISCMSSKELFGKFLERVESDYNPLDFSGNLTENVMCSLYVSRHGLQETELMEMHNIQSHNWSPFYYAIEPYVSKMTGGFLRLTQTALKDAIYNRYIQDSTKEQTIVNHQISFFQNIFRNMNKQNLPIPDHIYTELPWLCFKADDRMQLLELIKSVSVFKKLFSLQKYELLQYIDVFGYSNDELINTFDAAAKMHMVDQYTQQLEEDLISHPNVLEDIISTLDSYALFFNLARKPNVEEYFLQRMQKVVQNSLALTQSYCRNTLHAIFYRLACLYVDMREPEKALPLHLSTLKFHESLPDKTVEQALLLARSYHGTGTAYLLLRQFAEAERCFNESMRIEKAHSEQSHLSSLNISKSLSCIAQGHVEQGNYEKARELFEEVIRNEEELYKDEMPPEMSYTMTNLGICYRRLEQYDKAEEVYNKALKIKVNAVGHNHFDVAYAYFNLSNLARDRKCFDEAREYLQTTLEIFKNIDFDDSVDAICAKENMALIYLQQQNMADGLPYFWEVFEYMSTRNQLDLGLQLVYDNYLIHLLRTQDHAGVLRVSKAMIRCEKMRSFLPFLFLHYVDRLNPAEADASSAVDGIDRGLELYPDRQDLVFQKIELDLLPLQDIVAINKLLEAYSSHSKTLNEQFIIQLAELFEEKNWTNGAIELYEYWLGKDARCESFLRNLGSMYGEAKRLEDALKCFKAIVEINPTDPTVKEKIAYVSLCLGDLDTSKAVIKELEAKWPDNTTIMERIEQYKKEISVLEQKKH